MAFFPVGYTEWMFRALIDGVSIAFPSILLDLAWRPIFAVALKGISRITSNKWGDCGDALVML